VTVSFGNLRDGGDDVDDDADAEFEYKCDKTVGQSLLGTCRDVFGFFWEKTMNSSEGAICRGYVVAENLSKDTYFVYFPLLNHFHLFEPVGLEDARSRVCAWGVQMHIPIVQKDAHNALLMAMALQTPEHEIHDNLHGLSMNGFDDFADFIYLPPGMVNAPKPAKVSHAIPTLAPKPAKPKEAVDSHLQILAPIMFDGKSLNELQQTRSDWGEVWKMLNNEYSFITNGRPSKFATKFIECMPSDRTRGHKKPADE